MHSTRYPRRARTEATGVCTHKGDLVDLELKDALNAEVHVVPFTMIIAELDNHVLASDRIRWKM